MRERSRTGKENEPLSDWLPHSEPMILVDTLLSVENQFVSVQYTPHPGALCRDPEGMPGSWSLEIMAQCCALHINRQSESTGSRHLSQGRLIQIRDYHCRTDYLEWGQTLSISANCLTASADHGLWQYSAEITSAGNTIAYGRLSILAQ